MYKQWGYFPGHPLQATARCSARCSSCSISWTGLRPPTKSRWVVVLPRVGGSRRFYPILLGSPRCMQWVQNVLRAYMLWGGWCRPSWPPTALDVLDPALLLLGLLIPLHL